MSVRVRLLGRPQMTIGGRVFEPPADRRSALLYYLAYAGGWVPREDLLYLFWPDVEEHRARGSLRQLLHVTKSGLLGVAVEVEKVRVRWVVATDLAELADGSDSVWTGDLLEGFSLAGAPEFESWLELERAAWRKRHRASLLAEPTGGRSSAEMIDRLDQWLMSTPLDEEALRVWMQLAGRCGQRSAALVRFREFEAQLMEEVGLGPEPATVAVVEQLLESSTTPVLVSIDTDTRPVILPHRRPKPRPLPVHHDAFFGRDVEIARLTTELTSERGAMVTLLAPGGMGKTRLACEVAERLASRFTGVVFVPLAGVKSAPEVAPRFADALGLQGMSGSPMDEVNEALAAARLLVVLDNLEQVEGVAKLLDRWRELAPDVAWLLTSRTRVWVRDESIVELGGLPFSTSDSFPDADPPAVRLLLARARRTGRDLDPHSDRVALAMVARLAGGMPLALELAAGWLRVMPLAAIASELESGLMPEATPDPSREPRHASLRTVFESAWDVLSEADKSALARLAVFRGGFDERAALDVAAVGRPMLLALRNRSMLSLDDSGRFGWHPLLETYVRERTREVATAEVQERHARHFMDRLLSYESLGQRGRGPEAFAAIRLDEANIELAWMTAVDLGWWETLLSSGPFFGYAYDAQGRVERWSQLLLAALKRVPQGSVAWAVLEVHESSMDGLLGRFERAHERRSAAVRVLRPRAEESPYGLAWGLIALSESAWKLDRPEDAWEAMSEAIVALEAAGRRDLLGRAYLEMLDMMHDPVEHKRWFDEYMRWLAEVGADENHANVLAVRGSYLSFAQGDHWRALGLVSEALSLESSSGWRPGEAGARILRRAEILALMGDLSAAVADVEQYLCAWRPTWGLAQRGGRDDALALRASLGLARGEAGAEELVGPGSAAGRTLRGLLVRARLARLDGAHGEALANLAAFQTRVPRERFGYQRGWWQLLGLLEQSEVARDQEDSTKLASSLRSAVQTALRWNLFPPRLRITELARAHPSTEFIREVDASIGSQASVVGA